MIHKGRWVFMNESGIRLFEAKTYEDLIGKDIYEHLHPCDHEDVKARLKRITDRQSESEIINRRGIHLKKAHLYRNGLHPYDIFGETAVQVI
ncbi:PAS domain-containing protein [Bacillus licheniformis]|nr:PAS domain-containing protein [Bacillus licheniformis]